MRFSQALANIHVPDGVEEDEALARTTQLAIGAHHDDLEIMAVQGILACFQQADQWFTGVVMTDGRGSPRSGPYADYSDENMMAVRVLEQNKAALVGEYGAQVYMRFPSSVIKDGQNKDPVSDLIELFNKTSPEIIYTHNLADKHPTHVGIAVNIIRALRQLPPMQHPKHVYGCEVWRDLGWMLDKDKIVFDTSAKPNLQSALISVFDSQISGGKRYDLAAAGRRIANATFFNSHQVDMVEGLNFAMDLLPLVKDPSMDMFTYVAQYINRFSDDVRALIEGVQ
ncbi:MAG: PIG-L family deacetylase [Chloroflexota bacterium]